MNCPGLSLCDSSGLRYSYRWVLWYIVASTVGEGVVMWLDTGLEQEKLLVGRTGSILTYNCETLGVSLVVRWNFALALAQVEVSYGAYAWKSDWQEMKQYSDLDTTDLCIQQALRQWRELVIAQSGNVKGSLRFMMIVGLIWEAVEHILVPVP